MKSIKELILDIKSRPVESPVIRYVDKEGLKCITNARLVRDVYNSAQLFNNFFEGKAKGKHVAFIAVTGYELVVAIIACELLGAVSVLINPLEGEETVKKLAVQSDADLLVTNPSDYVRLDDNSETKIDEESFIDGADDFSFLLFTSGTTGEMKGVMLTQRNFMSSASRITDCFDKIRALRPDIGIRSCYVMLPFYHAFGLAIVFTALSGGVTLDMCCDFRMFYRDLQLLNSEIVAFPPMAAKMFAADVSRGESLKWGSGVKFVFSGGAPISQDALRVIAENHFFLAYGYGMTETAGSGTLNVTMSRFESAGKAAASTDLKIVDNEIYLKDDAVMLGYYKDSEKTAEVLRDGWVATGDLGYVDEDGFVYITGRKKNLIILSSGENVSPEELEAKLYANTMVKECKVYSKNDKIAADIYAPGVSEDEIRRFVKEVNSKMPMYKSISVVEVKDTELPKTSIGKIKR